MKKSKYVSKKKLAPKKTLLKYSLNTAFLNAEKK